MASDLDVELRNLVIDNWGLIHELHARASELQQELSQCIQNAYVLTGHLERQGLTVDSFVKSGKAWYLAYPGGGHQYVSYLQVEVVTDEPRPTTQVFTGFRSLKGIGVLELKRAVAEQLGKVAGVEYDTTGNNCVITQRRIEMLSSDVDTHVNEVVAELEKQAVVAEALQKAMIARVQEQA